MYEYGKAKSIKRLWVSRLIGVWFCTFMIVGLVLTSIGFEAIEFDIVVTTLFVLFILTDIASIIGVIFMICTSFKIEHDLIHKNNCGGWGAYSSPYGSPYGWTPPEEKSKHTMTEKEN